MPGVGSVNVPGVHASGHQRLVVFDIPAKNASDNPCHGVPEFTGVIRGGAIHIPHRTAAGKYHHAGQRAKDVPRSSQGSIDRAHSLVLLWSRAAWTRQADTCHQNSSQPSVDSDRNTPSQEVFNRQLCLHQSIRSKKK